MRTFLAAATSGLLLLAQIPVAHAGTFTRLDPLPPPRIVAHSEAYPGGRFEPANLTDTDPRTEYSSTGVGTNTYVEFEFHQPSSIRAFRHVDRNDPATVAESELRFLDGSGREVGVFSVPHKNQRAGTSLLILPQAVTAHRVRWRVSRLGSQHGTVGGAEVAFFGPGAKDPQPTATGIQPQAPQLLERKGQGASQPLNVTLDYPYLEPVTATLHVDGAPERTVELSFGVHRMDFDLPATENERLVAIRLNAGATNVASQTFNLKPVRKMLIYLLPHSHVDIGYTALQADVERKQNENIEIGLRLAEQTAAYPEGARFKWNVEVLWPVENYLRSTTPEKKAAFLQAVRTGKVGLDAFYGNILTGLCRPEELVRLMRYATRLSAECGVPIESAMISDVPGYTWSTVSAMAHAGVKYFSFAPNYFDRMGGTMKEWQNKPFWWRGPDGTQRVLCWCPSRGYALGHIIGDGEALARFIPAYLAELEETGYPFDISHLRWNVHGDNGAPDEKIADVVRDWNLRYIYPRLVMSTTTEAFRAFETRYGDLLPEYAGDYTPYWEDGAGSSAHETALNRASAERLVQAEALWAMRNPGQFPAEQFQDAWRNVLLYSEHTWGAHNSVSQPDVPFVRDQWKVKQAFALDADRQSRTLLAQALGGAPGMATTGGEVEVFNTASWKRSGLVTLSPQMSAAGDRVLDEKGKVHPSQRLSSGELVFLARDIPPFSSRRYRVTAGKPAAKGRVSAEAGLLKHPEFTVQVDPETGAISSLKSLRSGHDFADPQSGTGLNDYFYLAGSRTADAKRNGRPTIRILENGPLVASLLIESDAPGCRNLTREIRVAEGLDYVEIINHLDKLPIRAKEGAHLGYGFNVPDGTVRMDVGWAVVRPEVDQIPASCKNWFSVQRWVDISNDKLGVTWAPVDAPLVQVGGITANLIGSQTDWRVWVRELEPSTVLYSWILNNHWHTNYRADQEGRLVFRFALRPHRGFIPEEAARFGISCSQPLLVGPAMTAKQTQPRLRLSSDKVLVTALKPSDSGEGWVVRLFGASGTTRKVSLDWSSPAPARVWLSDTSELPLEPAGRTVTVPPWGIVTLLAR